MDRHEVARRMAISANVLITISLFVVMVWWRASAVLFLACWALYFAAWWIEGSVEGSPRTTGASSPLRPGGASIASPGMPR